MKSMRLTNSDGKLTLLEQDVAKPTPESGEVSIRVCAAGVTQTEVSWFPTLHTRTGEERLSAVPSHEFSGEVAELGDGVTALSIGQEVYGMNDWFDDGALAEYCITRPAWIASKPRRLTHEEAASVPIGALTAWQGLFDHVRLQAGERALIHGGAGAVGVFAIQLARSRGAYVITTASARSSDFLKTLGADEVLDYRAEPFEDRVGAVEVVFDAVGGETLKRSWQVLRRNGRLVTIAADSESTTDERVKGAFFIVEPRHQELADIGRMIDSGALRPVVDTVLPLSQAPAAYTGNLERQRRGKVVVVIANPTSRA